MIQRREELDLVKGALTDGPLPSSTVSTRSPGPTEPATPSPDPDGPQDPRTLELFRSAPDPRRAMPASGAGTSPSPDNPHSQGQTPIPATRLYATTTVQIGSAPETLEPVGASTLITPGRVLFGKYIVIRELGRGGMGEVWLVRHRELDTERALKLIVQQISFDDGTRARFKREARVMAKFSHPHAVAVHDAGLVGHSAFIEMEYVPGKSLKHVLVPGVPMPVGWVDRILAQLCDVLQIAHDRGIVHRDLKPSNLMLLDGRPPGEDHLKVLDFGIAKILGSTGDESEDLHTHTGVFIGTVQYSSPEQSGSGLVDSRSDLYSVGVILYEFLTGHRPFSGPRIIYDHLCTPPPPFAQKNAEACVVPEIEALVHRCLAKEPAARPQSARELAEEFHRITTALARPPEKPPPPPPRRRLLWATLVLFATLGPAAWAFWPRTPRFAIHAPATLSVRAGAAAIFSVTITRDRFAKPIRLDAEGVPPGVTVAPVSEADSDDARAFQVKVDPNAEGGVKTLALRATSANRSRTTSLKLTIRPPDIALPSHYKRAPGSKLVSLSGTIHPDRIVRIFPDGTELHFLLIPKQRPGDPDSFYIMRDKVWNKLFDVFARQQPARLTHDVWQAKAIKNDGFPEHPNERWPVMNVTAKEAHECSVWIGGLLPSIHQWEKASGLYDAPGSSEAGPFVQPWDPADRTQIAIDRDEPMEVGAATRDVSPLGCRDMAGNGQEWTRDTSSGKEIPLGPGDIDLVYCRGRRYRTKSTPLLYKDLNNKTLGDGWRYLFGDPEIGFRVVIEVD